MVRLIRYRFELVFFGLFQLLIFAAISFSAIAQETGIVKFQVDNNNGYFEILLDDTLLLKQYKDTLPVGPHRAEVWSYGYEIKEIWFEVDTNSTKEVYVKLDRSAAYLAYSESYSKYRKQFHKSVTLPISLTIAFGITSGAFLINAYDLKKQIDIELLDYSLTPNPSEIASLKLSILEDNRKYNLCRTGYYIAGGMSILGIAGSIYCGLKFRKNSIEPEYSKTSPFLNKSSFYFSPGGFKFIYKIG